MAGSWITRIPGHLNGTEWQEDVTDRSPDPAASAGADDGGALVLFSGGQDSTVCLAWALERFARVETVGFAYCQRNRVHLAVRARVREKIAALKRDWAARLGEDHVVDIGALSAISETALTRDVAIAVADSG